MVSGGCHRTYIFRGKTDSGKWVYGSLIMADDYCCILEKEEDVHPMNYPYLDGFIGTFDGKATPVKPETVSQYIIGEDRNGQMVFEGDVVRIYSRWGDIWSKNNIAMVVDKNTITTDGLCRWMPQDTIEIEVIGNIWDNRDLLNERSKKWIDNYYQLMEWGYTGDVRKE